MNLLQVATIKLIDAVKRQSYLKHQTILEKSSASFTGKDTYKTIGFSKEIITDSFQFYAIDSIAEPNHSAAASYFGT
ncbi:MAG: hypothetical protein ABGY95_12020 [Rubritalea sp.]|uniref:hypothetical protein n=1 Tax=Rubritalea sp. TaxID=2109375 RepID=UPI003242490B